MCAMSTLDWSQSNNISCKVMLVSHVQISLTIFNAEKSVGGQVKKFITSSFFNRIVFHLERRCRTFDKIYL